MAVVFGKDMAAVFGKVTVHTLRRNQGAVGRRDEARRLRRETADRTQPHSLVMAAKQPADEAVLLSDFTSNSHTLVMAAKEPAPFGQINSANGFVTMLLCAFVTMLPWRKL